MFAACESCDRVAPLYSDSVRNRCTYRVDCFIIVNTASINYCVLSVDYVFIASLFQASKTSSSSVASLKSLAS